MIDLSADMTTFGYRGAVVQIAEIDVREGGLSVSEPVRGVALTPTGAVSLRFAGLPLFRIHVPSANSNVVAWLGERSGVKAVPSGDPVASVTISFDGGATSPEGDPAELSDVISMRSPDGSVGPISRAVVALQKKGSEWRVVGSTVSDAADGSYTISGLVEADADVYLMCPDDLGETFEAGSSVVIDDLIHPTAPNGYVYRVVTGGELSATEPDWWTTGQQQVGTATLEAREYLRPLAHGPVDVTFL